MIEFTAIDPQLLAEFLDESEESLSSIEHLFVQIEQTPGNIEIINAIFRPVHSLKGNAAFFGLLKVKELAHALENILDGMRSGRFSDAGGVMGVVFEGFDLLRSMLSSVRNGGAEVVSFSTFQTGLANVVETFGHLESKTQSSSDVFGSVLRKMGILRQSLGGREQTIVDDIISELETHAVSYSSGDGTAVPPEVRELMTLLSTVQSSLGNEESIARIGEILKMLDDCESPEGASLAGSALDDYTTFMRSVGWDPLLRDILIEKANLLSNGALWKGISTEASAKKISDGVVPETGELKDEQVRKLVHDAEGKTLAEKTMRVTEKNIDAFLSFVEELIVIEENIFRQCSQRVVFRKRHGGPWQRETPLRRGSNG